MHVRLGPNCTKLSETDYGIGVKLGTAARESLSTTYQGALSDIYKLECCLFRRGQKIHTGVLQSAMRL
jgi:hypothetical protein